jgi:hypothetical protein
VESQNVLNVPTAILFLNFPSSWSELRPREKVVRDLSMAGCVEAAYNSPRPTTPASMVGSTGTELRTDGAVAVVQLRECQLLVEQNTGAAFAIATRPRSKVARIIRAQVLSLRNLWRENIVYDGVDIGRLTVSALFVPTA